MTFAPCYTYEHITSHGKRDSADVIKVLNQLTLKNREIILVISNRMGP